jgi:hypothetical protein
MSDMRPFARIAVLTALAALLPPAFTATIVSESRITVIGGAFAGETFTLPRVDGDWFVTHGDAHAGLALRPAATAAHQGTFNIEWDGKGATQTVNAGNNDQVKNDQRFAFHLQFLAPYNQTVQLRGADAIEITIVRMDDLNLEANIAGSATGAGPGPVRIAGVIKIHRDTSDQKVTGVFGNCDPGIHDKLVGAEWRSPSECEAEFDRYIRGALSGPFARVETALTQGDWEETRKPKFNPITSIARHSESHPYDLQSSLGGLIRFQFQLRLGSEQEKRNQAALDAVTQKMADAMKSAAAAEAFNAELTKITHVTEGSGKIAVAVGINSEWLGIVNFQGAYTASQIPGVGYSLTAPYVQSRGGGDIGGSHETTYVFLGGWAPATNTKSGGSDTNIVVKASLNPKGPTLSVQNIWVEIQANAELAQKAIGLVDWNALKQLLAAK